jgi:hypothetical protein
VRVGGVSGLLRAYFAGTSFTTALLGALNIEPIRQMPYTVLARQQHQKKIQYFFDERITGTRGTSVIYGAGSK